jgi:hypothetical protein
VAVAMLVGGPNAEQPVLGPRTAQRLASLGITRVSLLGDASGFGVVLEGWAFDATDVDDAVRAVFPGASPEIRVFREIQHVAVAAPTIERS